MKKTFLGDGVYIAELPDRGGLVLTTEDGETAANTIVLEPEVIIALVSFIRKLVQDA